MSASPNIVPNQFPKIEPSGAARIAIVGQSPGRDEDFYREPFVGESGWLLNGALERSGLTRSQCFVGNVSRQRPGVDSDDFALLEWDGPEVQSGLARLREDLERFRPTIVLCLGNEALHAFKDGGLVARAGNGFDWPNKITAWRGSLFESGFLGAGRPLKCMATWHPAAVRRDMSLQGYYRACAGVGDFERLRVESERPELVLPPRRIGIVGRDHTLLEGLLILSRMLVEGLPVAWDIEGGPGNITSVAFSRRPETALVFPLARTNGESVWSEDEEVMIWEGVKGLLEAPDVPKIAHHAHYDWFAVLWALGIVPAGEMHDTEELWWEKFAELSKGLATLASMLTKEPFYKPDREDGEMVFESDEEFWTYNGRDAAVTMECWTKLKSLLEPPQLEHYRLNCELFFSKLMKMARGLRVDKERVKADIKELEERAFELQARIDEEANGETWREMRQAVTSGDEKAFAGVCLRALCGKAPKRAEMVEIKRWQPMKRGGTNRKPRWVKAGKLVSEGNGSKPDEPLLDGSVTTWLKPCHKQVEKLVSFEPESLEEIEDHVLKSENDNWLFARRAWKRRRESPREALGQIGQALGLSVNVGSNEQGGGSQTFLFKTCKLPMIFKDEWSGRYSRESEEARKKRVEGAKAVAGNGKRGCTDQVALSKLYATTKDERVLWVLQLRRLRKAISDLSLPLDNDGRMRYSLTFVKDTGRMAASESPLGTGTNPMALNKDLRHIVIADEGCELGQLDLRGADSWTVAARCAALGDTTMLDDLRAGLKPAQIMVLIDGQGARINKLSRVEIKNEIAKGIVPWLYAAHKSGHHGYDYGMGAQTLIDTVLKYSMADLPLDFAAKPVVLTKEQAMKILECNGTRYPGVKRWHEQAAKELLTTGALVTSTGHVRLFFGRKSERKNGVRVVNHDTLKQRLGSEAQFYTTYAIKLAEHRLWYDEENRRDDGSLRVESLLCVHDSMNPRWRREDRDFARRKLAEWFENEIEIAGARIVIPADGTVSQDWGMEGAEKL